MALKDQAAKGNVSSICLAVASSGLGIKIGEKYASELQDVAQAARFIGVFDEQSVKDYPVCDLSVILISTGGTEHILREIASKSHNMALLYLSKYNSLPATIEFLAYYREQGREPLIVEEYMGAGSLVGSLKKLAIINQAVNRLMSARLGVIGGISSWLIYSRTSEETVRSRIGAQLIDVNLEELVARYEKAQAGDEETHGIINSATGVSVENREVSKAYKLYRALESILKDNRLDGFTIKCFDMISRLKTTACVPLSLFNTDLLPASCEGDVPLLITMALGEWVTLTPVFMANVEGISSDHVTFAHCTSPIVGKYTLLTHFESGLGVGIRVDYGSSDKVTAFRLDSKLTRIRIGVGKLEEHEWSGEMCRTQLYIRLQGARKLVNESIGNHYAIIRGDYAEELEIAAKMLGLEIERI